MKREQLIIFAENLFNSVENNLPTSRKNLPLIIHPFNYMPEMLEEKLKVNTNGKKVLVVTDSTDKNENLGKMIQYFQNCFSTEIEIVNIYDVEIKGGCLGCIQCGYDNVCVYEGKDEFKEFWNVKLKSADILVFAGNIVDRYFSSRWKMVYDRSFFNGHIPLLKGKQFGFLISGPLGQTPNLRQLVESIPEFQDSNLVDIITDEYADSKIIDSLIYNLAKKSITFSLSDYKKPHTFLAIGGSKVFRDMVYGRMRFVFQADHRYYEEHGFYDFPHDDKYAKKMNEKFIPLTQNEKFRKTFYSVLKTEMIKPLKRVVENPDK